MAREEHDLPGLLDCTAGKRFDPPIEFRMITTTTPIYSWVDVEHEIDFFYSDTGVYSCVGVEAGAQPVATTIANFELRGENYDLDMFAGVIFTRSNRRDINTIRDLKDKVVGALEIGDFAGAQVQFYAMGAQGMNYIMDPKQVIFVGNQLDIVRGVANGDWDVGMVRTGMLELTEDENGELYDTGMFKVLDPKIYVMDDGKLFPFLHSTPAFPEWPVYSAPHTPSVIIEEVQMALQAFGKHQIVGEKIAHCKEDFCEHNDCSLVTLEPDICDTAPVEYFDEDARCDTTRELANLAYVAGKAGHHHGFRSPRSYFDVRTMQEAGGFLNKDDVGDWRCTRAETLYGAVLCPTGYHRVSEERFVESCHDLGVPCPDGLSCFCKPCVEAFQVREYVEEETGIVESMADCKEMEVCAYTQQTKKIIFRGYDQTMGENTEVRAVVQVDLQFYELHVDKVDTGIYEFAFSHTENTIGTLRVFVNDLLIPGMPIQVRILPRDCEAEFGGRSPSEKGECICGDGNFEIGESCLSAPALFITLASIVAFFAFIGGYLYLRRRRIQSDQLWHINVEELHFNDPIEVIGQGAFGVVLLAEYRGTKVAIKRVIKPKNRVKRSNSGSGSVGKVSGDDLGDGNKGLESQDFDEAASTDSSGSGPEQASGGAGSYGTGLMSGSVDVEQGKTVNLDFLANAHFGAGKATVWQNMCPSMFQSEAIRSKAQFLDSQSSGGGLSTKGIAAVLCPMLDRSSRQKEEFMDEMRLLSRLRHPYITTVMGAVVSTFSDPMLVMEYMEYGSLYDLLRNETMYAGGDIILQIVRDISQGLRFLHSSKPPILHGDLKARNILIDSRFRAKVADFGLSTKKKNGLTGTPYFMAPEYLRGKTDYTTHCDIYSLGVIFFEIYAREDPYKGENMRRVLMKVCNPSTNKRPHIPETMPPKFVEITKKCWSTDPFYRPQAKDLDLLFMDMQQGDAEPLTREEVAGKEKKNTVDMLYEVFPRHIADALKAGKKVEPETHELVTVFFSDIVGFTTISRKMSPTKVCDMLERLYEAFDKLARAHKVFKVETIGDAYMCVTNLDHSQEKEHVKNIAEFAIEAIEAAGKVMIDLENPSIGCVKIRVGFHSGPVVSNVIGSLNPRYGLFGDTVNTASRMESSSYAGRIHCSEKSAKLLKEQAPKLRVKKRGKVAVKGKGEMMTYWVQGAKEDGPPDLLGDTAAPTNTKDVDVLPGVTTGTTEDTADDESEKDDGAGRVTFKDEEDSSHHDD